MNKGDFSSSAFEPLVSIIIPCYNAASTIGEAIESALSQRYPSVEVIVVDDGSTDNSLDVIRSFGGQIRWQCQTNRGACASRNVGLAISQGDLIQFLDADDILMPHKLDEMVPVAVQSGQNYLTVCNWLEQGIDPDIPPKECQISYESGDPLQWCLFSSLQTSSPIHWRESLLAVNGFDETLPRCQEFDLHLRMLARGMKLKVVFQTLFVVRRQHESLSSDYVRILREHPGILLRLRASLQDQQVLSAERNSQLAGALARGACHLAQRSQWADARTLFLTAEAIIPGGKYLGFHRRGLRYLARFLSPAKAEWLNHSLSRIKQKYLSS